MIGLIVSVILLIFGMIDTFTGDPVKGSSLLLISAVWYIGSAIWMRLHKDNTDREQMRSVVTETLTNIKNLKEEQK